jgi:hypothetical protein
MKPKPNFLELHLQIRLHPTYIFKQKNMVLGFEHITTFCESSHIIDANLFS